MESPSQAPHSGGSTWKGFLLTASILSCWIQPTSAQSVSVVPNPPYGTVGSSVVLDIKGLSEHPLSYAWYRRELDPSNQMAFYNVASGQPTVTDSRLNVFSNGSLLISNLRLNDTENYIALLINSNAQIQTIRGPLVVYGLLSIPTINSNNMAPVENKDNVSLTCQVDSQDVTDLVLFINQSSPVGDGISLSPENKTLTIINVTREDQGPYECEIWNPVNRNRSQPFSLNITYGPDSIKFSPSPEGDKILVIVNNPLTLVCQVESYPPAQYEWRVNGTVNSNFFDNTYTINNASWEDSGSYTCLAWNNVTNLSVSKDVTVSVEKVSPGRGNGSSFSTGDIAGIVIGVLAGVALTGGIIYFFFFRKTGRASKHHHSEKNCSAPKHGEDTTLYENTACQIGSAVSAQGLDSSPAFPQVQSESPYQALDITQEDVYEMISPWKNPQAEGRHKSP